MKRLELLGAWGDDSVAKRLEVTLEVGQWGAQLVSGVDDKLAAHLLLLLKALRHLVERVRERGHFVRSGPVNSLLVCASGDPSPLAGDIVECVMQPSSA